MCVRERERESECVCVCVRERGIGPIMAATLMLGAGVPSETTDAAFTTVAEGRPCISDSGFRVSGFKSRVSGSGFRVSGFGFRVSGFGFRVSGFWLQVSSFGFRVTAAHLTTV